jgi:hypothetical protein
VTTSRIPLYGGPCAHCGYPAAHLTISPHGRSIVHQDPRQPPCTLANPDDDTIPMCPHGHKNTAPETRNPSP